MLGSIDTNFNATPITITTMTEKELSIYNGLHLFRPEIAHFYKDGLEIIASNYLSKSNLLGHLLREIDSGLRGVLEVTKRKEELKKKLTVEFYERLFEEFRVEYVNYRYLSNVSIKNVRDASSNIASILSAFDFELDSPLAKRYVKIAIWFHKYAHRDDTTLNTPRDPEDILKIWSEYEEILIALVGNSLPILDRIDTLVKKNKPDENVLNRLPFLLNTKTREDYFYNKLRQVEWLLALYQRGHFAGCKNPTPIEMVMKDGNKGLSFPRWGILDYLLFCANEIKVQKGDFATILKIIDDISSYRNPNGSKVLNPHTDDTIIRLISQLPNDKIEDKHFYYIVESIKNPYSFSTSSFESFIKKLIETKDKNNLLKCLDILFSFVKVENQAEQYYPIIEISFLIHIREKYGDDLINICGNEGLDVVLKKLTEIAENESFFDVHTIEDHPQNWDVYKYILQLVFFVRNYLLSGTTEYLMETLNKLIYSEKEIYQRLAFHVVNIRYEEFHNLLWSLPVNPLDNLINKHELFELIKRHQKELEEDEQAKVLKWIETISYNSFRDEKDYDQIVWHSKKEWLLALEEIDNENLQAANEKYSKLYPYPIEHPGFSSWISSQVGFECPISLVEIEKKNLDEVIDLFSGYEKKNTLPLYNFDVQGLAHVIEEDIINNIKKYTENYEVILSSTIYFKYTWLMGISRFIESNNVSFDTLEFLMSVYKIIDHPDFWKNEDVQFNYNDWVLNRTLSIILILQRKGVVNTDVRIRNLTKGLLQFILRKTTIDLGDYSDLSHLSLNHSHGKLYEALINHMLLSNSLDWDIKVEFESMFKRERSNPLLCFSLGKYWRLIYNKDFEWANGVFNMVFPKEDLRNWKASMEGYHLYTNRVHKDILTLLKSDQHYDLFITNVDLFESTSCFFIITHLLIAFDESTSGFNVADDLFRSLIYCDNITIYQDIINAFIRGIHNPNPEKIKIIWADLWNFCKDADSEAKKYFLQESYRLLDYIKDLDGAMEDWILSSSQYMDPFQARYFFDKLIPFVYTYPEIIGRIVLNIVTYKDVLMGSNLGRIVEELYKRDLGETADTICNILAEKGNDELRPIYIKYKE